MLECMPAVAVREVDLGECSVGDYRSAAFLVQNNSDLPALVKPFVESDTLSVPEKEVLIAPRAARTVQVDRERGVDSKAKRETHRERDNINIDDASLE